ncbi:Hypothetical_protein [Hexamita inflata]|uniref:Hypothetical_protein n=1 Tax=Hexamita inflata TaxID=28002 RepID=A0AA86NB93_9EUKA|nr:Hypothetical protein HINF_LOCUS3785 [Hexamita inflata]
MKIQLDAIIDHNKESSTNIINQKLLDMQKRFKSQLHEEIEQKIIKGQFSEEIIEIIELATELFLKISQDQSCDIQAQEINFDDMSMVSTGIFEETKHIPEVQEIQSGPNICAIQEYIQEGQAKEQSVIQDDNLDYTQIFEKEPIQFRNKFKQLLQQVLNTTTDKDDTLISMMLQSNMRSNVKQIADILNWEHRKVSNYFRETFSQTQPITQAEVSYMKQIIQSSTSRLIKDEVFVKQVIKAYPSLSIKEVKQQIKILVDEEIELHKYILPQEIVQNNAVPVAEEVQMSHNQLTQQQIEYVTQYTLANIDQPIEISCKHLRAIYNNNIRIAPLRALISSIKKTQSQTEQELPTIETIINQVIEPEKQPEPVKEKPHDIKTEIISSIKSSEQFVREYELQNNINQKEENVVKPETVQEAKPYRKQTAAELLTQIKEQQLKNSGSTSNLQQSADLSVKQLVNESSSLPSQQPKPKAKKNQIKPVQILNTQQKLNVIKQVEQNKAKTTGELEKKVKFLNSLRAVIGKNLCQNTEFITEIQAASIVCQGQISKIWHQFEKVDPSYTHFQARQYFNDTIFNRLLTESQKSQLDQILIENLGRMNKQELSAEVKKRIKLLLPDTIVDQFVFNNTKALKSKITRMQKSNNEEPADQKPQDNEENQIPIKQDEIMSDTNEIREEDLFNMNEIVIQNGHQLVIAAKPENDTGPVIQQVQVPKKKLIKKIEIPEGVILKEEQIKQVAKEKFRNATKNKQPEPVIVKQTQPKEQIKEQIKEAPIKIPTTIPKLPKIDPEPKIEQKPEPKVETTKQNPIKLVQNNITPQVKAEARILQPNIQQTSSQEKMHSAHSAQSYSNEPIGTQHSPHFSIKYSARSPIDLANFDSFSSVLEPILPPSYVCDIEMFSRAFKRVQKGLGKYTQLQITNYIEKHAAVLRKIAPEIDMSYRKTVEYFKSQYCRIKYVGELNDQIKLEIDEHIKNSIGKTLQAVVQELNVKYISLKIPLWDIQMYVLSKL